MFIEVTDHLRCPRPHDEGYLVLLPDRMEGRHVVEGQIGCPSCGWEGRIVEGVLDTGGAGALPGITRLAAEAVAALLGLTGPGGFVALAGEATTLAGPLSRLLPGVHWLLLNPPSGTAGGAAESVLRGAAWPVKSHALRGVVLGESSLGWRSEALASLLPGLRLVGEGPWVPIEGAELLAAAEGVWVAGRPATTTPLRRGGQPGDSASR